MAVLEFWDSIFTSNTSLGLMPNTASTESFVLSLTSEKDSHHSIVFL